MKALKSKTTSSNLQPQQASKPSFEKDGEATFFSEATNDIQTKPFFSFDNNTTRGYTNNDKPFFSPATIQPKLTIGQPNDKYEQEADAMADEVVQQMEQTDSAPAIQAKCNQCEEEDQLQKKEELEETDKDIQEKPIFDSETEPEVQTKIEPSPVVAPEPVVTPVAPITTINVVESPIQKEEQEKEIEETEGELDLQRKTIFDSEDDPPKEETVMTKSESGQVHATDNLQKQLNSSKGSGSSLPNDTRSNMESSFGADFSSVNIHTGSDAVQMNKGLGAQAFTHGNDIYFNEGKYDTSSSGGKHLLAHELTHTVQQGGGIHKKEDVCETDKKDKTKETAKQKETTPSKEDCPPKKTKPEQPKKGTKKPDEEEKTLPISSKEGASVNDRQSDAPSPLDTAPEVGNANKEDAKDAALDPCDKKPDAKEGGKKKSTEQGDGKLANGDKNTSSKEEKTKDSKKEPQKGDASFLDSLINKGNTGHLVPDGLGEAASPELLAEKETTIQNGNAAREGLVGLHAKVNGLSINDLQFRRPDLAEMNSEEGAQVTAAHNQSSTIANQFVQLNANRLSTFIEGSLLKAELIRKQTQSQKDQIQTTIQEKRLLAKATSQSLIARAKEKATSSIAAVNAKHLNSILKIELETLKSKLKLQKDHQVKVRDLADFRLKQLGSIELSYLKGYQNTLQVGKTYGIKAAMLGRVMGREYEAANGQDENTRIKVTQPKKDGFWDGYLTHNKYMARAKSAREVGKQYQEGMEDQAKKQAEQMLCGKPKDLIALNGTTQWATKQLQCTLDTGLERIEANRTLNLQKAEENRKALFELINKSTQVTIDQLKLMEKTQLQFLTDYGIRQSMAIERDSEKSITALLSGVSEAGNHLWESLMFFNSGNKHSTHFI